MWIAAAVCPQPAPVQVCWAAYPGTTGLTTIDFRLTDPYLDPPGLFDRFYSEASIRLPDTFWCYEPLASQPAVNPLPAADRGHITFGSLNNFCKVNEAVLKLWTRVLNAVDGSRLVLLVPTGSHRERTLRLFERKGIAAERITIVGRQPREAYLRAIIRSILAWIPSPTTATQQASTPIGWACRWSRWRDKRS